MAISREYLKEKAKDKAVDMMYESLFEYILKAVFLVGGFWGAKKIYNHWQKSQTEKQSDTSAEVRQAQVLRSAMNPSGIPLMRSMDTTNVNKIFAVADEITNLDAVIEAYKNLYKGDSLMDDLRRELSDEEFEKFTKTVQFSKSKREGKVQQSSATTKHFPVKSHIVTVKQVHLRRTPEKKGDSKISSPFSNNIIDTAPPKSYLGIYMGEEEYDRNSNTFFIKIHAPGKEHTKVNYWVAASHVEAYSYEQILRDAKKYKPFRISAGSLRGITGKLVQAVNITPVYDEKFRFIKNAAPGQILGELIMELQDNNGNSMVKFRTAFGTERWTDKKFVRINEA